MAETIDLDARDFAARVIRRPRVSKPDPRSRARQPEPLWVRVKHATGHGRTYSIASSTGKWSARQVVQSGRLRTLGDLRRVLTATATIKAAEPARSPASRVSAKDVEPDYTRKCSVCRKPPALPLTGMCEACTYGEAPG